MQIIKPTFRIIEQENGIDGVYKQIEYAGRICYGSQNKICEGSAKPFVENVLMKNKHGAPMEHGAIYLDIVGSEVEDYHTLELFFFKHPYARVDKCYDEEIWDWHMYVSTNYRVLYENDRLDLLKFLCEYKEGHHERIVTVEFTCNLGVSREFNRHRHNSINEESTRYCNYSKDKFGGEIKTIMNNKKFGERIDIVNEQNRKEDIKFYCLSIINNEDNLTDIDYWLFGLKSSEYAYINLVNKCGWMAQDARDVLPLATKTTLIHTAFVSDWEHFFDLRALGTTGAPHPQAKELATPLMEEFINRGYIIDWASEDEEK